ncbi:MAG: T9SS type A sorting domain-containing protein, partial [Gemmatimonadetes bacterium]|nr:T9SS type A sorting domain-containing protein [Gemmatimonadota bacterium]
STRALLAEATGTITDDDGEADEPQARLTPDPSAVAFSADDPAWKTFTVHTSLDSVLVRANPSGSDPAIEVSGGQQAPTRDYCPAEGNDRPTSGRRDGWNLHVKACQAGQTKILLIDYDTGEVVQQYEVNVKGSGIAATTALNPSYPNPFNSETVLSYTLPTAADIRLEVFTLSGQRVAVLHEGFQAAGYHTLSLDAAGLASGVYLYRLTTPEGRFARKFTLLR